MTTGVGDVIKHSITAANYDSPVIQFMLPYSMRGDGVLPPNLPEYWSAERDKTLYATITAESMWSSAVSIACTKMASSAWEIESDIPLRVKRGQELLLLSDLQRGWVTFISKHLQSYLLTDNGAFIEVVRQTTNMNSQIIGLVHLDSMRCMRTGDPERPVIYMDRNGRLHELERHEVIYFSDMPDAREMFFGVGHCAASRAYSQIIKLASIEQYVYEKVTGRKIKEVHFVSGVNEKQVANFKAAAESQADARGLISYMGAVIVPVPGDKPPETVKIPLAEFPDGFNRKEEFDIALLEYAAAIGIDSQDLQPLSGRNAQLGTAMQSEVLDDKAKGRGLSSWRMSFVHDINEWVLPDMCTMAFIEKDWRDKISQATYNEKVEKYTSEAVQNGLLTEAQGLQALVDEGIYPDEFLPEDVTPDKNLMDDEKPVTEQVEEVEEPEVVTPVVKETVDDLLSETESEAVQIVKKIKRGRR